MNKPRNHHIVSQVHLKNFFNHAEGKIYLYDKERKNYYSQTSTRKIFSEIDSNTRYKDGINDFEILEKELNDHFEKDFNLHYSVIEKFTKEKVLTAEFNAAIKYLAKYGIIGEFRAPRHKRDVDEAVFGTLKLLLSNSTKEIQRELDEIMAFKEKTKYSNLVGYKKLADDILEKMGNLIFRISVPLNEDEYFFVTDCGSATRRAKINEYFNPDIEEVAYISLALSSKLYIEILSSKLENVDLESKLVFASTRDVNQLNWANLYYCESKVACENEAYLKKFIEQNFNSQ